MSENEGTLKVDSSHFLSGFDAIGEYNGEEVIGNDDGIYRTSYRNYENGHTVVFKQTFRNINEVRPNGILSFAAFAVFSILFPARISWGQQPLNFWTEASMRCPPAIPALLPIWNPRRVSFPSGVVCLEPLAFPSESKPLFKQILRLGTSIQ